MDEELVRVANLYYRKNMTQQEIAAQMGMSRQRVSRMLKKAQEKKIVEIRIRGYTDSCVEIEEDLTRKLSLSDVRVVDSEDIVVIADAALEYIEGQVGKGETVGISFGNTLAGFCRIYRDLHPKGTNVVQLLGSVNMYRYTRHHQDEVTTHLANMFGGEAYNMYFPAVVENPELKRLIYEERVFKPLFSRIARVDVAVVTTGALLLKPDNVLIRDGYFRKSELEALQEMGCVGDVCLHFIDKEGNIVDSRMDDRIIGVTADQLKKAPNTICVSYGAYKAASIIAASQGGYIDRLVTNRSTAEAILARC